MSAEIKSSNSFISLVKEMDVAYRTQRDRGTMFELLSRTYFKNEPMYERLFDKVWTLNEVPVEYEIPKNDTGVDLVARERETGNLVAIQCKYYAEDLTIQKLHIDSFLNEVGKKYYARGIIITSTDKWGKNAEDALVGRDKIITRISLTQLQESNIDWSKFKFTAPEKVTVQSKKTPRRHQVPAIEAVVKGFETADRGKLIMAPGTGKTYTSMAIAEELAKKKGSIFRVLYLVPSIQLLSQTLRGWTADTNYNMDAIAVCSDRKVTKQESKNEYEDIAVADIGYPATTSTEKLLEYQSRIESNQAKGDFITVFSTYQSIDVIIEAQQNGFYEFDLVVCDEAHRTTGATELNKEDSSFTKVHYDENIKTAKRLYQTATPRVYGEGAKQKAEEMSVVIADMDNPVLYGKEFYRIGFGDAIRKDILTDYKVMVLAVDEEMIARRFQQMLANKDSELEFDDVTKIIGCWNGLVRRKNNSDEALGAPMNRAIAFAGTIRESKLITDMFSHVVDQYLNQDPDDEHQYNVEIDHADGSMNALEKNKKISWLKGDVPENTCRILSNARFLTEGVDIPDLDAIMFLKPRKSKIDIAQAVGRVMRKTEGKDYGYVILPIGVPAGKDTNSVLDNNEKYRVVWEVLNALRSLDERFDATINKLELNKKKPEQIQIIGVGDAPEDGELKPVTHQLELMLTEEDLTDLERAIYGKIVRKVGNVRYWEDWSKDVAEIAQQHMTRIRVMLEDTNSKVYMEFQKFVKSLRYNINDSISYTQAIEMVAQHLITKPVFEALFDSYSFVHNNPVSKSLESILAILDEKGLMKEQERLNSFYDSVRVRAEGVDNLKAKQDIIIQLYDKFFKVGFKETTERLGIVFTPVEVVDFIIHSVDDVLKKHFGKSLASEGVHLLDPFTGTGTFITRLLQSGLIPREELLRKYTQETHANEIVLLSYYIAAINIEETFHNLYGGEYIPFEGIVLTDTFESTETKTSFTSELFNENNERLKKQKENPIFAIVGNPPYSVGQTSANDDNRNVTYTKLKESIDKTYSKQSKANLKKSLYDMYIQSFRWASDRLEDKGVIGFVTNASFVDSQSTDGFRKCLHEEFNYLYIFNLRGDQRTLGEQSRKEGGKIFGSGSRTPIAISILVKDGSDNHDIFYHDIGEYLSREDKLNILGNTQSITNLEWNKLIPDKNNDWINQRDLDYDMYQCIDGDYFITKAIGVSTNRDAWVYGFDMHAVQKNTIYMVENYNNEVRRLAKIVDKTEKLNARNFNDNYIKWSTGLANNLVKGKEINVDLSNIKQSLYRPFTKKWLFYDTAVIERPGRFKDIMPENNKIIYVTGSGASRGFSAIVTDLIPNLHLQDSGQAFLKFVRGEGLFGEVIDNIPQEICNILNLSSEDVFNYVYAILHSKEYKDKYANDLGKGLPRIPILKNKEIFTEVGKKLVNLHLNYENIPVYKDVEIMTKDNPSFIVNKMKHPKKGKVDTIIYNGDIIITNIPKRAYEYIVNGKPAIQWIMEQYQVKSDKASGIVENPNNFSSDEKYIFNLLLRIINVSMQTIDLIDSLPPLEVMGD
ncbi:type ISP restriction/modification enzyme [Psychrobacillus sp. OK032]|uniref:DEAD/DEAH box helicase n=1 Tax=Psychrobacillus sp. OK032 TaxID=1884358 RepID=UPI0008BD5829|nr:type ISP restriction/modification enzyme [Psychrobacillus sp. OK032]SES17690.1 Predicted helicase [Psychrobacillus sp. OK032]